MLVNIEVENQAEHKANELCDGVCPPNVVDISCEGKKIRNGKECDELAADGDEH